MALAGLAYGVVASFTHPFTWAADIVTAAPLALAVLVVVWATVVGSGAELPSPVVAPVDGAPRRRRAGIFWLAPVLAFAGWELYCYASLPRVTHPTLSSLIDIADATRFGKTVVFATWLVLGWFLVTA
jgi:hypothetical protein